MPRLTQVCPECGHTAYYHRSKKEQEMFKSRGECKTTGCQCKVTREDIMEYNRPRKVSLW